jgi:hypothetical protein
MSALLPITTNNYVQGTPSTYSYSFPTNANLTNKQVALSSINLYYSWYNITNSATGGRYNNNSFQYIWIDGTTITVTLPNGFYQVSDMNAYWQYIMQQNGHYLIDNNGNYNYYLSIQTNVPQYAIQVNSTALPSSLPAGWSYPSGTSPSWVTSSRNPQFVVLTTNNFKTVIGFATGTYPSAQTPASNQTFLNSSTPDLTPVNSILVSCTLVRNQYSSNSFIIGSFSPVSSTYATNISYEPKEYAFCDCSPGQIQTFTVQFLDESFNPIYFVDTTLCMQLLLRDKPHVI